MPVWDVYMPAVDWLFCCAAWGRLPLRRRWRAFNRYVIARMTELPKSTKSTYRASLPCKAGLFRSALLYDAQGCAQKCNHDTGRDASHHIYPQSDEERLAKDERSNANNKPYHRTRAKYSYYHHSSFAGLSGVTMQLLVVVTQVDIPLR